MWCRITSLTIALPDEQEMDDVYALPYIESHHPSYEALGTVFQAIREDQVLALSAARGCFGAYSFCALRFIKGPGSFPGQKP